jgi:hypothetical protein
MVGHQVFVFQQQFHPGKLRSVSSFDPVYIGIGMAVNPRIFKCEVITLRGITLKVIALSDHKLILNKVLKIFVRKHFLSSRSR